MKSGSLPYGLHYIDSIDRSEVLKVLKSGLITQGPEVKRFEDKFAKYVGSKYAVACASGTAALHMSCLALGINSKSRVLTSAITFVASANCAEYLGAKVDFVDVDEKTFCISVSELEKKLKKKKNRSCNTSSFIRALK